MPYTKEELENNEFYQAIANSARDEYEAEKQFRLDNFNASGSQPGNNLLIRKENGAIVSYEDPETGQAFNDPSGWIKLEREVIKLKRGSTLDDLIDRQFSEF